MTRTAAMPRLFVVTTSDGRNSRGTPPSTVKTMDWPAIGAPSAESALTARLTGSSRFGATASRFASRRMALPVPTLTGALDAALALSPGPVSEWAIGIYERTTISLLTQAIGGGAIAVDPESRVVSVTAR